MDEEVEQKAEWRARLMGAIIRRDFDDDTLAHMLEAGLNQAHSEGLQDAADICDAIIEARPHTKPMFSIIANAIRGLDERNKAKVLPSN